jgi:calcium/calmodulin-dependent protein kinase I
MELAKGGELTNYLKEKKLLPEADAKRIFKQIHESVKYIHSKNVIHRDINPNNILFLDEARENIVLIDFGISGFYSGNVKEKINAGTVRFVPPEVKFNLIIDSFWIKYGFESQNR